MTGAFYYGDSEVKRSVRHREINNYAARFQELRVLSVAIALQLGS
jgi:hypothetical protein